MKKVGQPQLTNEELDRQGVLLVLVFPRQLWYIKTPMTIKRTDPKPTPSPIPKSRHSSSVSQEPPPLRLDRLEVERLEREPP